MNKWKNNLVISFIFLIYISGSTRILAQEDSLFTMVLAEGDVSPPTALTELAWIVGEWRGPALGGVAEEFWMPAAGGQMLGTFRLIKDEEVQFYELLTIREHNNSLLLSLKHFNPDLSGWEEKLETEDFKLVKVTKDAVYFNELSMIRSGEDEMDVYVRMHRKDGGFKELHFPYKRILKHR